MAENLLDVVCARTAPSRCCVACRSWLGQPEGPGDIGPHSHYCWNLVATISRCCRRRFGGRVILGPSCTSLEESPGPHSYCCRGLISMIPRCCCLRLGGNSLGYSCISRKVAPSFCPFCHHLLLHVSCPN